MMRALGLACFGWILAPLALFADIPLPKDLQYVQPLIQFEGLEEYPEQIFFVRYMSFSGAPSGVPTHLAEIKDAKAIDLRLQRRIGTLQLLALDRKEYERKAKDGPANSWLTDKTPGVRVADLKAPPTTAPVAVKSPPTKIYSVRMEDGKLIVTDRLAPQRTSSMLPLELGAVVVALSVAWFGIWFARRKGGVS